MGGTARAHKLRTCVVLLRRRIVPPIPIHVLLHVLVISHLPWCPNEAGIGGWHGVVSASYEHVRAPVSSEAGRACACAREQA